MFLKTNDQKKIYVKMLIACIIFGYFIGVAGASNLDALNNSCVNCHKTLSPFTDEQKRFNEIRLNHTERNISCSLECHEDVIRKKATDNFQQWSDSVHSNYFVTCDACHGGNSGAKTEAEAHSTMKNVNDPNSTVYFKNIPDTCGKCHVEELTHFKNTMHYQRLKAESRAPSCITCHSPHTFKVLKASELTPLCSVCHNQIDQIAIPSVPKDAQNALEKANEFKDEVLRAKNAVAVAKAAGKDVSSAQMDLDKAISVMNDIPSLWHGFNLKDFDQQVQNGINFADKAQYKASGVEPTVPRAPAPGIALLLAIFGIIYLIRKW
ncbi:Cytochrome c7 c [uncultured archaeon]|nr:Cytochrome c7 c [uncultured archaeon]